jgi:prepilin-type N-terminal cleavage/methylation domain-containing protein
MPRVGSEHHNPMLASSNIARRVSRRKAGFTLIEILIVVAIIVILAAVVIPVAGRMKAKAHSVQCVSNLRQLAVIATTAASDTGSYPPMLGLETDSDGNPQHTGTQFYLYTTGMECVMCPSAKYTGYDSKKKPITAYGGNPMVMVYQQDGIPPLIRPSQIQRPEEVMLMGDCAQHAPPTSGLSVSSHAGMGSAPATRRIPTKHSLPRRSRRAVSGIRISPSFRCATAAGRTSFSATVT